MKNDFSDKEIISKFDWYGEKITTVTRKENKITLEFDKSEAWRVKAFGSVTINYMFDNGYRVSHWNFMDEIAIIGFVKTTLHSD